MYVIYALVDPRDNTVRYVGVTNDVYKRFLQHVNCSGSNFEKNAWIHELRMANKMIVMETLEEVEDRTCVFDREEYWIKHFQMLQEPITNIRQKSPARRTKKTNLRVGRRVSPELSRVVSVDDVPQIIIDEKPAPPSTQYSFDFSKLKQVRELVLAQRNQNEIICEVWGVQENTRAFRVAKEEFRQMLAYLASLAGEL